MILDKGPTIYTVYAESDEDELIALAQQDNDEAYGELVRRYQARLRAYASRYVFDPNDVFEIVQDAFLNAYRHLNRFEVGRPFYPWLRSICHNLIMNHFSSQKTRRNINLQLVDDAICERVADHRLMDDPRDADRVAALRDCVSQLSESQQKLIRDRYHTGVAVKDIASALKATATSVSMRLGRIRTKLRQCMVRHMERMKP